MRPQKSSIAECIEASGAMPLVPRVLNLRRDRVGHCDFYIGRGSPWGIRSGSAGTATARRCCGGTSGGCAASTAATWCASAPRSAVTAICSCGWPMAGATS